MMEAVIPWQELEALIEPHYPKAGNVRQLVGLSIMLRVRSDSIFPILGAEDALYESPVPRRLAGVDLGRAAASDETTILRFRACWKSMGYAARYWMRSIIIWLGVDNHLIAAPSSIKNSKQERDSEMHQTEKGEQLFSGPRRTSVSTRRK